MIPSTRLQEDIDWLIELQTALPWLKRLADARTNWRASDTKAAQATATLEQIAQQVTALWSDLPTTVDSNNLAQAYLSHTQARAIEAKTFADAAAAALARLAEVATAATCRYCGQPLTSDHVTAERHRLVADQATKVDAARRLAARVTEAEGMAQQEAPASREQRDAQRDGLVERQRQRAQLDGLWRTTARQADLYRELARLLGRDCLQRFLLQQAEEGIVSHANQVLDRLSSGLLELTLQRTRNAAGKADGGYDGAKALDLMFCNRAISDHRLPIDMLSGSQRFRVAVSLALGIGQYTTQGAHPVEAVIIDEGFGSLDVERW